MLAAVLGGGGEISDAALAAYRQKVDEANGTALPPGAPVACRPERSAHLAVVRRDLHSRLRRSDIQELLRGQASPPEPEPVIDIKLGQISLEFENMRSGVDEEADAALEASMVALRQFSPLLVARDRDDPEKYILLAGFSRFRIAQKLGWTTVKVIVRSLCSELEAYAVNLLENVAHAPLATFDLADRCDLICRKFGVSVPDLAKLIGKAPSYVYQLRGLLASLPSNALRDWRNRHPAATLPNLVAVTRAFDKPDAWEKVRARYECSEGRTTPALVPSDEDTSGPTGWTEFKRPSKAALRRLRDVASCARLPDDPRVFQEILVGVLDYARGATNKIPHLLTPPLKRKRPQRQASEE
jgi:ParB/RepB/Spo0J family partition protein